MARKCKEETDKTYGLLLDAAEEVFSRKGYANATFHEIAERAGLTRGAIYWHFSDKYQMLDAVLRRAQLPWDCLPERFGSLEQTPSLSELGEAIGSGLNEIVNDPRLHRVTLILLHRTELVVENQQVYCRLTAILDRIKTYLIAVLSWRYRSADGTPHRNIPAAASSVNSLMTGALYEWLLNQAQIDLTQIPQTVERLIGSFMGGADEAG
uniref:TetR family transcriptional regulator TtgR n=1 Tax=Pseudomonas fluorescens TaxID=294 RepID=A0A220IT90_PSEFL|nr:TetR family transcriptional regulator [Pseudomonas fluorescens]ASI38074.1 Putative TetR family transcriptional regulator TtgR [Pseudomonas fluorescens]AWH58706.1 Putative TetR family transcriptional regulator TtgR [Pseudomonas fluorescens]